MLATEKWQIFILLRAAFSMKNILFERGRMTARWYNKKIEIAQQRAERDGKTAEQKKK